MPLFYAGRQAGRQEEAKKPSLFCVGSGVEINNLLR